MRTHFNISRVAFFTFMVAATTACDDDDVSLEVDCRDAACEQDAGADDGASADSGGYEEDSGDTDAGLDASDDLQEVTIRFKAKLGEQDLVCGQQYSHLGTTHLTATPQDFRFFVQDVRLLRKGSGQEERVQLDVLPPFQRAEVALIDFTDATGKCAGSGGSIVNTVIRGKVPAGTYDGIVFVNGVPEELNHAGPAESAGAPLDDVTLFWSWLGGYRFIVAELLPMGSAHDAGQSDAALADGGAHAAVPDGGADAATGHSGSAAAFVHIGSTGCSGTPSSGFDCVRKARNEIRLHSFDPAHNVVVADLAEVFKASDLSAPPQCHGVAPPCSAPYAAFGIDMNTGNPAATQQVFRVE